VNKLLQECLFNFYLIFGICFVISSPAFSTSGIKVVHHLDVAVVAQWMKLH